MQTFGNGNRKEIYKMLPIKSQINTWGDEIYFDVPTNRIKPDKTAKEVFELGEIAFLEPRQRYSSWFWANASQ